MRVTDEQARNIAKLRDDVPRPGTVVVGDIAADLLDARRERDEAIARAEAAHDLVVAAREFTYNRSSKAGTGVAQATIAYDAAQNAGGTDK